MSTRSGPTVQGTPTKGTRRLAGFNERIIALYARGMTVRDIQAHLAEIYDVEVSPDLISRLYATKRGEGVVAAVRLRSLVAG